MISSCAIQVATLKNFIGANKGILSKFSQDMDIASLSGLEGSSSFLAASVQAGVALAMRQVSKGCEPPWLCPLSSHDFPLSTDVCVCVCRSCTWG